MQVGPPQQVGGARVLVKGMGHGAVCIFQDVGQMAPVLAEHRALHGKGAHGGGKLIPYGLPQIKIFVLQGIRFLHAAQEYIHQFYQLFLALAAHGVAGEGIVRKTVHKGSITFAVHVKEDIPAGILLAGGQNEMFQYMGIIPFIQLRRPVNQVKTQFPVVVLNI